ncbi:hypothetical protein V6N12_017111 [Hibiscus sabdariffa]|uniref:Uncharacterized protein n=1 Tax=Hibiscus sabdariffa TaxID=183260 RepID=A0ABR2BDP9_9ROSI
MESTANECKLPIQATSIRSPHITHYVPLWLKHCWWRRRQSQRQWLDDAIFKAWITTVDSVFEERCNVVDSDGRREVKIRVGNMRSMESEVGGGSVGYKNGFGWDDEMVNRGRNGGSSGGGNWKKG